MVRVVTSTSGQAKLRSDAEEWCRVCSLGYHEVMDQCTILAKVSFVLEQKTLALVALAVTLFLVDVSYVSRSWELNF